MVGVPGRSKACHNCRKRRIKCDEGRPGCHNCAKSYRLCLGYQRNYGFILSKDMVVTSSQQQDGTTLGNAELLLASSPEDVTSGTVHISRWRANPCAPSPSLIFSPDSSASSSGQKTKKKQRTPGKVQSPPPHHHNALSIPVEVSRRNIFRDLFFSLFVVDSIATNGKPNPIPSNYVLDILQLPALSPALENATLALCAAKLGRRDKQPELVHQSLGLYTESLRNFAREVGGHVLSSSYSRSSSSSSFSSSGNNGAAAAAVAPKRTAIPETDQTLAACMIMMLYEVSECPAGSVYAYQAHYRGTVKLLELRGPEAHRSGLSHSVFQAFRVHNMFLSFIDETKSLLSEPEWCSVPFDRPKEHFDQVLDILLNVANLTSERRQIRDMRDPQAIFRRCLATIRKGLELEARLAAWLERYRDTIAGPLYYPELSRKGQQYSDGNDDDHDSDGNRGRLFPVAYRFPAFSVAQNMLFYWTALLSVHAHLGWMYGTLKHLLETTLDVIRPSLACTCHDRDDIECIRHFTMDSSSSSYSSSNSSSSSSSPLPPLGHRLDWPRTIAYDVCQSVEYCMQERARSFGPVSILPVLSVVKGHWVHWPGDWSREIAWVDRVLSALGQEKSLIARHLVEL